MSWNLHINHISLKISKAIGILYRLKTIYPQLVLQTLYNTLILPYFNYCILAWGAIISEGNPLHLLQKKALRLISNSNYIAHTEPIGWRPELPRVCARYEIRSPVFHLPVIKHKFAEHSLRYCLIKQLNREKCSILITSKVHTHSFQGYKRYLKNKAIDVYSDNCDILECYVCQKLNQ